MLDIKFIREHKDIVLDGAKKKRIDLDLDRLITLDNQRLELLKSVESLRSEQNSASQDIATADPETKQKLIASMQEVKSELQTKEAELKAIESEWRELMYKVPMMPDMSVPDGDGEEQNVTVKEWGTKPDFNFEGKDHIELARDLDLIDFERGTKVHGFRGYFLKNELSDICWALFNHARKFYGARGFQQFIAPAILRKDNFYKTGHLPNEAEDLYHTQDGDYLSGTAEVAMMGYHSDEILDEKDLPLRYLAFSPCYRREAGSYSKDTKGIIRVHEFMKIEQLILAPADYQLGMDLLEEINKNFEEFLESIELPYQQLLICSGDLSGSKVKQYDTEGWVPSQNQYRELSSASYFSDFQCRRFNIRYRTKDGSVKFAHSLNSTAVATPRILVPLLENNQQADGSIQLPNALEPYLDSLTISPRGTSSEQKNTPDQGTGTTD